MKNYPFKVNQEKLKALLSNVKKDTSWKDKAKNRVKNNPCSAMDNWHELHG